MVISNGYIYHLAKNYNIPPSYISCMAYELKSSRKSNAFYYNQLAISCLPDEIRRTLWQRNAVPRITELFWEVYARVAATEDIGDFYCWDRYGSTVKSLWLPQDFPYKPMTWSRLLNSWLYKTMDAWVHDMNIDLPNRKKVKRALFDIAMAKPSRYAV